MLIARRADTRARADFATWKMLAKLNGASALPREAQAFLESYKALLKQMSEAEATEATIKLMYKAYYGDMGGAGAPPELPADPMRPAKDNVTAFKRPPVQRKPPAQKAASGSETKPRLPVALIFACLVLVYVGIRYFWP
jgi:hypothetical protein